MEKKLLVAVYLTLLPAGCGKEPPVPAERKAPERKAAEKNEPAYGFPLEITIDDVPEVPKEILGPSPPIEEEEE